MMIELLFLAAAAAPASATVPRPMDGLSGCWSAPGKVLGKKVDGFARGERRLGGHYFMLQLRSGGKEPYSAAIIYGSGEAPEELNSYWMDSMGGAYATTGKGRVSADEINVDYVYPEARYANHFVRSGTGWTWSIVEMKPGKPPRLFAEYQLSRGRCRNLGLAF